MVEYLEQLVEEKKWREALLLAERLIGSVERPVDLVRIQAAVVVSHCRLGQQEAALASGESAIELARSLEAWDSFGELALWVGVAYGRLGQHEAGIARIYDYLSHVQDYTKAFALQAGAWYNLGVLQAALGRLSEASRAYSNSLAAALRRRDFRYAHGVRQALLKIHLETGALENVPRLLAQCGKYLRNHPDSESHAVSWAYHIKFRGEYALATDRMDRAQLIASRSFRLAESDPLCEFLLHSLLSKIASRRSCFVEAAGHALAARTCAVALHRSDLETEANALIYEIAHAAPSALEAVDHHYLADF